MSRQKDFEMMAKQITGDKPELIGGIVYSVILQAAEYGCQYGVDKVCDILNHYCNRTGVHPSRRVEMIDHIRKEMKE